MVRLRLIVWGTDGAAAVQRAVVVVARVFSCVAGDVRRLVGARNWIERNDCASLRPSGRLLVNLPASYHRASRRHRGPASDSAGRAARWPCGSSTWTTQVRERHPGHGAATSSGRRPRTDPSCAAPTAATDRGRRVRRASRQQPRRPPHRVADSVHALSGVRTYGVAPFSLTSGLGMPNLAGDRKQLSTRRAGWLGQASRADRRATFDRPPRHRGRWRPLDEWPPPWCGGTSAC